MSNIAKAAESSFVDKVEIKSNKGDKSVNLIGFGAFVNMMYYESLMQDTVKVVYTFEDTAKGEVGKTIIEDLPIVGTEEVNIKFKDNNDNKIKLKLHVNNVNPLHEDARKTTTAITLVSEEFLHNEGADARVNIRYDGKISDHVQKILKQNLKSKKKLDVEDTSNNLNFVGNNKKPMYTLNWLSKHAVPTEAGQKGKTAGFLFFETSEGFHFKSIDALMNQKQKKSYIYNESPDSGGSNLPAGYDGKVLDQSSSNLIDAREKYKMGAYGTRLIVFDPFNCKYEVIEKTAEEEKKGTKLAGKDLPKLNSKFDSKFYRTTYMLLDTGTLPEGSVQQQIDKSGEQNFESKDIYNQAVRRYNQLFSSNQTITIPGDFSLHAGDMIHIDVPGLRSGDTEINKEFGGLYIISDLCHYISPTETYTKLNLVRDSFGRKPKSR
mgnify:CR=1 FL=1